VFVELRTGFFCCCVTSYEREKAPLERLVTRLVLEPLRVRRLEHQVQDHLRAAAAGFYSTP